MPSSDVMTKYAAGELHSGSAAGPAVKSRKQAIAIMLSEKRNEAQHGGTYQDAKSRFNDHGHHGEITGISKHSNGKHVELEVAHGRRAPRRRDEDSGKLSQLSSYDDRPKSRVVLPAHQASQFSVGQRVGVGAVPLTDEEQQVPPPKHGKKGKAKSAKPSRSTPVHRALGVEESA